MQMDNSILARFEASEDIIHNAGHGRLEQLKAAIAKGGNVNHLRTDISALMLAVRVRSLECVQVLLEAGADPNHKTRTWWTALSEAARNDTPEFMGPMVEKGANLNAQDAYGMTPLLAAVSMDALSSASALLKMGCEVNTPDYDKVTPLMEATKRENKEMVGLLLASGAAVDMTDVNGKTAMDIAKEANWSFGLGLLAQAHRVASKAEASLAQSAPDAAVEPAAAESVLPISKIGKRRQP